MHRRLKAPYLPSVNEGEKVNISRVTDVEDHPDTEISAGVDTFGGFSFVAGHSQTGRTTRNTLMEAVELPSSSSAGKATDRVKIEFGFEFQSVDG